MDSQNTSDFIARIRDIPDMRVDYAIGFVGGSASLYEKVLIKVCRLIPANIGIMDQCLFTDNDLKMFAIKAHGVKGSLNQSGCTALAKQAEDLENAAKRGDSEFCAEQYPVFREGLRNLFREINSVIKDISGEAVSDEISNIRDYYKVLVQAKEAAYNFDSITASELLAPLTRLRFGGGADEKLMMAVAALDVFQPYKAVEHILQLMSGTTTNEY